MFVSLINAVERKFTPESPIELLKRDNDRVERFKSLINGADI